MTPVADRFKLGYLPLRHPDEQLDIALRNVVLACRMRPLTEQATTPGGSPLPGFQNVASGTAGDLQGGILWPSVDARGPVEPEPFPDADLPPRDLPGWAFAWPSQITGGTGAGQGAGATFVGAIPGDVAVLPTPDETLRPDVRFEEMPATSIVPDLPVGTHGITLPATHERRQVPLFYPADGTSKKLVAVNAAGDPAKASLVYDLTDDDRLDEERKARLHSMMRVIRIYGGCFDPFNDQPDSIDETGHLAWQFAAAGQDALAGYGLVVDRPAPLTRVGGILGLGGLAVPVGPQATPLVAGAMSPEAGGPLDVGTDPDQHELGRTIDGVAINSGHISTAAYFKRPAGQEDAPIEFGGEYVKARGGPNLVRTHLRHDPTRKHSHPCGSKIGLWRLETEIPVDVPEDDTPTDRPPTGTPRPPEDGITTGEDIVDQNRPRTGGDTTTGVDQDLLEGPTPTGAEKRGDPNDDALSGGAGRTSLLAGGILGAGLTIPESIPGRVLYCLADDTARLDGKRPANIATADGERHRYETSHLPRAASALLARANVADVASPDRCADALAEDVAHQNRWAPIVGRLQAITGLDAEGRATYTERADSRWRGGCAKGGFIFLGPCDDAATAGTDSGATKTDNWLAVHVDRMFGIGLVDQATGDIVSGLRMTVDDPSGFAASSCFELVDSDGNENSSSRHGFKNSIELSGADASLRGDSSFAAGPADAGQFALFFDSFGAEGSTLYASVNAQTQEPILGAEASSMAHHTLAVQVFS